MAKFKAKDKVVLKANIEENWPKQPAIIIVAQNQKEFPGMYLVAVEPENEYDDGIREIHEDAIMFLENENTHD